MRAEDKALVVNKRYMHGTAWLLWYECCSTYYLNATPNMGHWPTACWLARYQGGP